MEAFSESVEFGPYRLKAKIAQGGMADVLLATCSKKEFQGQFIAVKRLLPHLNSNKAFVELLIHEAKIGVLLNHPGIAQVYDLGSHKSEFFIAMEYIHGKSLDRVLERIKNQTAPRLPAEISTYIILELLRALSFAHQLKDSKGRELNIIHRDVTPGNILLGYRGEVKLVDFGIATAESRLQHGFSQSAMGKIAYISPEQAVNDPVLKASDIYSLGVVYYELLSGQLPFQAENANALLKKVIEGRITDLKMTGPAIAQGLRDIVTNCLNKSSRKRVQSCPELFQLIIEHFKRTMEIDFSSRATREYYKKKLCEYLRAVFEADMISEIEVVQKALQEEPSNESLKATAPQIIPASIEQAMDDHDSTVFEADHTDEATRHYPLTETERKKILMGLPPREVIERQAFVEPTRKSETPHAVFNLATIPEYDLAEENSSLRRVSIKEKLAISSLNKDQKETLKDLSPSMEISSQQDLEAFEQSTFSGAPLLGDIETRPLNRADIQKDFEEIERNQTWHPVSSVTKKQPKSFKTPPISGPRETMAPRMRESKSWMVWSASSLIAVIVGAAMIWGLQSIYTFSSKPALLPTKTIYLAVTGEVSAGKMLELSNLWRADIQKLSAWFNEEYRRISGRNEEVMRIQLGEPEALIRGISAQSAPLDLMKSGEIFNFLKPVGAKRKLPFDSMIFLYLYPYDDQTPNNLSFPSEFSGNRPDQRGIVFAPAYSSKKFEILLNVAREIAFLYGARDRRDPGLNIPLNPEGMADPNKKPLFPQFKAELMGKYIALSSLQKKEPVSFDELVIGPATAIDLGWKD